MQTDASPAPDFVPSPETVASLERQLRDEIRGDVRFDRLVRTVYSTDASLYRIVPAGVVWPRDRDDVIAIVHACRAHGVSIVPRGAGTGIAGGALGWGVQLDFSKFMHTIGTIDTANRRVTVGPGAVLDDINAAAGRAGLQFPADVATSSRATIGGMIGNNSAGSHSVYYGRTVDSIDSLTVVLDDGSIAEWRHLPYADLPPNAEGRRAQRPHFHDPLSPVGSMDRAEQQADSPVARRSERQHAIESALSRIRAEYHDEVLLRYPRVLRRNGGYALDRLCQSDAINPATLIIGGEGTLGLVVAATLRLVPLPRFKALLVLHFASVLDAVAETPRLLAHRPAAIELVDELILRAGLSQSSAGAFNAFLDGCPPAILICELYDDDAARLERRVREIERELAAARVGQPVKTVFDAAMQQAVWTLRNKGFGLLMSRPGDRHPYEFIEDAAVDPSCLPAYIAELDAMLRAEGVAEVGYYAHASVGVIHVRPALNLGDAADVRRLRRVAENTADLVARYGGAMTGEHGDGIVRSEWLERMYGPRILRAFREVKQAFDPTGLFNPRKIVDPLPMDQRLRAAGAPRNLPLWPQFDYSPHRDLRALAGMCSGVGACRQKLTGTMCPSYMATLDERHTTRARAVALRAALSDDGLLRGLDDPALDEVMDLCLMCKACKSECPTGVDMARMKAEWLWQRGARRGLGRAARFLASAPRFARLGSLTPSLANWAMAQPRIRNWLEHAFGVDRRIAPPRFASQSFKRWWSRRGPSRRGLRGVVVYVADTWMNAYWPRVGQAAVALLEAAGYEVLVPSLRCCGRPAISKGMLDHAIRDANENIERLVGFAQRGAWIVGSEPSCILTYKDEYLALLPTEKARLVASRVRLVDELLAENTDWCDSLRSTGDTSEPPVLLHAHCHQKAHSGTVASLALLRRIPALAASEMNTGCCGMAGSFGHEKEHYEVARAVGEQRLFPAIRAAPEATIAVTGFSCREQIGHHTGVAARHVLEIVADHLMVERT